MRQTVILEVFEEILLTISSNDEFLSAKNLYDPFMAGASCLSDQVAACLDFDISGLNHTMLTVERVAHLLDGLYNLVIILSIEGRSSRHHHIQHYSQ